MKRNNPRNLKNIRRISAAKRLEASIANQGKLDATLRMTPERLVQAKAELKTLQDRIVS